MEDIGRTNARTRGLLAKHGKRMKERRQWKRDNNKLQQVLNRISATLKRGGDIVESPSFSVIMANGVDSYTIRKAGYDVVIVAPAAALDEAVARFKNPELPPAEPVTEITEVKDALVDRGDINESDPELSAVTEGVYQSLGCQYCNAAGTTMGEVANALEGIIPAIVKAGKKVVEEIKDAVDRDDRVVVERRTPTGDDGDVDNQGNIIDVDRSVTWDG